MPRLASRCALTALTLFSCMGIPTSEAAIPDGHWQSPEQLFAGAGNNSEARTEIDSTGNTVVVWISRSLVLSTQRAPGGPWTVEQQVSPVSNLTALNLRTAMDAAGNVLAVWEVEESASVHVLWAARYLARAGWDKPINLTTSGKSTNPVLSMNATGFALLVWQTANPSTDPNTLWAKHYTPGNNSWSPMKTVESTTPDAIDPQVVIDANGNGMALWRQFNNGHYDLTWSRYRASDDSWGPAAATIGANVVETFYPRLANSPNGDATAIWFQRSPILSMVPMGSRFSIATGRWDAIPTTLGGNAIAGNNPQLVMSDRGNAVAVWSTSSGNLQSVHYSVGKMIPWSSPVVIDPNLRTFLIGTSLGLDANGNALVSWVHGIDNAHDQVYIRRNIAGATTWGSAEPIGRAFPSDGPAFTPKVAVNAIGTAEVVWTQTQSGLGSLVWANRLE